MQYVDKCDITAPEGWTVELDIAASMLKVTAPAEGVGIPAGTVTLDAVSAEELTESFETQLSLKGIATGDDFVAFGKAVTEAAPLDEFMQEGTVILLQDVDLSAFSQTCFVGRPKIRSPAPSTARDIPSRSASTTATPRSWACSTRSMQRPQ